MNVTTGHFLALASLSGIAALIVASRAPRFWLGAVMVCMLAASSAAGSVLIRNVAWDWRGPFSIGGESVHLGMDGISAWFLLLVAVLGGVGALYASEYWKVEDHPRSAPRGRVLWIALLLCLALVLLARHGLQFLVAWEAFAVGGYFLIMMDGRRREVRAAGWLYLGASHAGTLALFAFFSLLAASTGSWELGPVRHRPDLGSLYWLAMVGFGVKAGMFPLHVWLPSAHANAPSHVSAILSGVAIKMGIYGLVRFGGWLPITEATAWTLVACGVASSVLGVAFALGQHDLKRLLAYHSVENIGIILIGMGFALVAVRRGQSEWGAWALAGGLLHVWNHGLFKALLFLGAGSVLHATGTREMSQLGGIWRAMPWTTSLFALGSAAITGLPPLNGFVSEWLIYLGMFDALKGPGLVSLAAIPAIVLLAVTGALALACFVKVCGVVFLGSPKSPAAEQARECGLRMRTSMMLLGLSCLAIGLSPVFIWPPLHAAVAAWQLAWSTVPPPPFLASLSWVHGLLVVALLGVSIWLWTRVVRRVPRRAVTWDCGYAVPSSRMQYTAGSFAAILTDWFSWILRSRRQVQPPEGSFPAKAAWTEHTPETVLEHVIEPLARRVMSLSGWVRQWQHGRVQAYLFYLMLGVAVLAALSTLP